MRRAPGSDALVPGRAGQKPLNLPIDGTSARQRDLAIDQRDGQDRTVNAAKI